MALLSDQVITLAFPYPAWHISQILLVVSFIVCNDADKILKQEDVRNICWLQHNLETVNEGISKCREASHRFPMQEQSIAHINMRRARYMWRHLGKHPMLSPPL